MKRYVLLSLVMFGLNAKASIINPPPAAPTLTVAQYQQLLRGQVGSQTNQMFRQIIKTFSATFTSLWQNPNLTPQQAFSAFGTDAGQLFVIAAAIQTAMNTIQAGSLPQTPPYAYTVNADGTVTIGAPVTGGKQKGSSK